MYVAIVHHYVDEASSIADKDVFDQIRHIEQILNANGIETTRHMLDSQLTLFDRFAHGPRPDLIFNLIETYQGEDRWMHIPPSRLDELKIPYTGSSAHTLREVNDKHVAKLRMIGAGIPTAPWLALNQTIKSEAFVLEKDPGYVSPATPLSERDFIIKSRFEHASVNLEQDAVGRYQTGSELVEAMVERAATIGPCVAEQFIDGREFNLSVLEMQDGQPRVMRPAEIDFSEFPNGQRRLVGYRAKWIEDSIEYNTTPRRFLEQYEDELLVKQLSSIALQCWHEFGLRGYARVDFRVDALGQPWVLEINANPCIAPWSGFTAACEQSGISASAFIPMILESSFLDWTDRMFSRNACDQTQR